MLRAGIYIRKSRQDKGQEAHRLELQRKKLPAHAAAQGWSYELYDDDIISGAEVENRREMVRLIADIEKGHINIVLCIEFSRLSRDDSMTDYLTFLNLCAAKKVKLATPERQLDPTDTSSWFLAIMEGGFSAVEMKTLKKRLVEGREVARSKGRWMGGPPPYGFDYDKNKKLLIPNPEQAAIIRKIFHERTRKGKSIDAIVKMARNHRWPLPGGGTYWWNVNVFRILKKPVYAGLAMHNGELIKAASEPLIDRVTWEAAQPIRLRPRGNRTASLLLTGRGRVRCGYCGSTVNCVTSRGKKHANDDGRGRTIRYYHCYGRNQGLDCRALRNISEDELDRLVISLLGQISRNKREILSGIQEFLTKRQGEIPARKKRLENQLQHAMSASQKILNAYEQGIISVEQLKDRNEEHKKRIDDLRKSIMDIDLELAREGLDVDLATLEKRLDSFQADLTRMDPQGLRALVDPLISKARLFNEKVELTFSFPVDGEHTHVYALPGKPQPDSRLHKSMDDRISPSKKPLNVPVAQWIEHVPSKHAIQVRFLSGTLPLELLASPRSKVTYARARAF